MINNNEQIKTSTYIVQFMTVALIVLSYITSRYLVFLAGGIAFLFLLSNVGWEQKFSLMFFVFPFCGIFTFEHGQTSVFMLLRIALIIAVLMYDRKKISTRLVTICMVLVFYMSVISISSFENGVTKIINVILWYVIAYFMVLSIDNDNVLPLTRSLSNGTILSGIVGVFISKIPSMQAELAHIEDLGYSGELYDRFTGLFNDPNLFTLLICAALWTMYYEYDRNKVGISEYIIKSLILTFFGLLTMSKSAVILIALYWIYIIFSLNRINIIAKFTISISVFVFLIYFFANNPDWLLNIWNRFIHSRAYYNSVTMNDVTTGRVQIWGWYLDYMYQTNCWIFGNGLGSMLPRGRAAHNTILQLFFIVGIVGTYIFYKSYKIMYNTCPDGKKISSSNKIGWYMILFVFATMMFLDGFTDEVFHYLVPLSFIYMRNCEADNTEKPDYIPDGSIYR